MEKKFKATFKSHADRNCVGVKIYYDKGNNYNTRRGYYLSVTPLKVEPRGNFNMESFSSDFCGFRCLLSEVTRKSAKALAQAETVDFKGICQRFFGEDLETEWEAM